MIVPSIIGRKTWGARYREGFGTRRVGSLEKWLHHSVTTHLPVTATQAQEMAEMRKLEAIGQSRFAGGISYPFIIFPSGRIYEGLGIGRVGAHTKGHNVVATAFCLAGNYMKTAPSKAQQDSIIWLLRYGVAKKWWKSPALTGGHRDTKATSCPGDAAYRMIPDLNKRARAADPGDVKPTAPSKPTPKPPKPPVAAGTLRKGSKGARVKKLQQGLNRVFPSYSKLLPDGDFQGRTEDVVKEFQRRTKLVPDGVVASLTTAKLAQYGIKF